MYESEGGWVNCMCDRYGGCRSNGGRLSGGLWDMR